MAGEYDKALAHAKAGRLEAAQSILLGLDDPKSEKLLAQVTKAIAARGAQGSQQLKNSGKAKAEPKNKQQQQVYGCLLALVICGLCYAMTLTVPKTPSIGDSVANDDASGQESLITQTIRTITDIDLQSVQVLHREDGYSAIIITYHSQAFTSSDFYAEYGSVFGAVGGLVRRQEWDFDDLSMVVGDRNGNALQIVSVSMADVIAFLDGEISIETFSERMTITDF